MRMSFWVSGWVHECCSMHGAAFDFCPVDGHSRASAHLRSSSACSMGTKAALARCFSSLHPRLYKLPCPT